MIPCSTIEKSRKADKGEPLPYCSKEIGPLRASGFLVFARLIERWASEMLFALTTMKACSQRVELRAAYALRVQGRYDV